MVGPRIYELNQSRSYPQFKDEHALMDTLSRWFSDNGCHFTRKDSHTAKGKAKGMNVNFKQKFKLHLRPMHHGLSVNFVYYAKTILGRAAFFGIITGGISTVVGVGTIAIHIADADRFAEGFWSFVDSMAGPSILERNDKLVQGKDGKMEHQQSCQQQPPQYAQQPPPQHAQHAPPQSYPPSFNDRLPPLFSTPNPSQPQGYYPPPPQPNPYGQAPTGYPSARPQQPPYAVSGNYVPTSHFPPSPSGYPPQYQQQPSLHPNQSSPYHPPPPSYRSDPYMQQQQQNYTTPYGPSSSQSELPLCTPSGSPYPSFEAAGGPPSANLQNTKQGMEAHSGQRVQY